MDKQRVGAVIIGGEHPGLGVARSLGRRGIPICVIDDQQSISRFSKYVDRVVRVNDLRDEHRTLENLLDAGRRYGLDGWVLVPTRDETVATISRHRNELAKFFRVTTPEWDIVRWAWHKGNTYQRAEQLGIPVPRTFNPRSEAELSTLNNRLPLAVKPAVKENFFYATGAKAWRAETPEQLKQLFQKAARQIPPEEILIQEIIPGDGQTQYSYCAFFRDGRAVSTLIAKRLRQHPHEFGRAATYVETVEMPEIEELSLRFLRAINYYGLVELEFKRDHRDGQYKLLDVNARTWGFHSLGSAAGVDFPYLLYADQIAEPIERVRARPGVGWLRLITDVPTVASALLNGNLKVGAYGQSLMRTKIESVFSMTDPLPSVAEFVMLPYLVYHKYLSKSAGAPHAQAAGERKETAFGASASAK
jgi:D-aspartate ligase